MKSVLERILELSRGGLLLAMTIVVGVVVEACSPNRPSSCGSACEESAAECADQCEVGSKQCEGGRLSTCVAADGGCGAYQTTDCASGKCQSVTACEMSLLAAPAFIETVAHDSIGGYLVQLKWSAVDGASRFQVGAKGPGYADFGSPVDVAQRFHSTLVELPEATQSWEFKVRAVDANDVKGPWSSTWVFRLRQTLVEKSEVALAAPATAVAISQDGRVVAVALEGAGVALYQVDGAQPVPLAELPAWGYPVRSLGLASSERDGGVQRYLYAVGGDEGKLVKVAPESKELVTWAVSEPGFIRSLSGVRDSDGGVHALFLVSTADDLVVFDLLKKGADQYELNGSHALADDLPTVPGAYAMDLDVSLKTDDDGKPRAYVITAAAGLVSFVRFDLVGLRFMPWEGMPSALISPVVASSEQSFAVTRHSINGDYRVDCYASGVRTASCFPSTFPDEPRALLYTPLAKTASGLLLGGGDLIVAPSDGPLELYHLQKTRVVLRQSTAGVTGPEGLAATAFRSSPTAPEAIRVAVGAGQRLVILEQQF